MTISFGKNCFSLKKHKLYIEVQKSARMKCVGKVSHLNSRNLAIVNTKSKVPKNTKIYDSEKRIIGRVVNIFGPVSEPYLAISPNKGMRITKIIGREVYKK